MANIKFKKKTVITYLQTNSHSCSSS